MFMETGGEGVGKDPLTLKLQNGALALVEDLTPRVPVKFSLFMYYFLLLMVRMVHFSCCK